VEQKKRQRVQRDGARPYYHGERMTNTTTTTGCTSELIPLHLFHQQETFGKENAGVK